MRHYRRNADEDLRDLERMAAQGDPGAEARLARARERAGMKPKYILVERSMDPRSHRQTRRLSSRWTIDLDRHSHRIRVNVAIDGSVPRQSRMLAEVWRPGHLDWSEVARVTTVDNAFPGKNDNHSLRMVEWELLDRASWAIFGVTGGPVPEPNPYRFM
jgi:hypothetical protein